MIIGIDLGTTNSSASYMGDDGPRLLQNALGERLTPSVVALDAAGKVLFGREAKELMVVDPERCVSLFKRHMGSDWQAEIGHRKFTPEELSSLVLRSLKEDAEAHFGQPVTRAVITVPAYFNEHQRKSTINAGHIAGLHVERILNEPTAAAIAYGFHDTKDEKILAVLDLGGGTFDVSIVELFEGVLEVRASSGETSLGGEDFTRALAARMLAASGFAFERTELEHPRLVSRMIQQCEAAKCRLSQMAETTVRLPNRDGSLDPGAPELPVTRADFESWTRHILNRVELPIRRALGDAKLTPGGIDEVILVGGATRMPMFQDRATQLFGKAPRCQLNPDEVVALGAGVQAGLIGRNEALKDMVVTDVAPFTLGIEISKKIGLENVGGYFLPIINRNTTIPVSRINRVSTVHPNQTSVKVEIYQGESRRTKDNLLLGEFDVKNIPRGPAGQDVDIRFTYDLNGVLEVEAIIVETGEKFSHLITRYARGLTAAQIAAAVDSMQKLKSHPREETANRFLLRRAERIYQELSIDMRQYLDQLLLGFEQSLELAEPELISRHREALEEFLNLHDSGLHDDDY